MNIRLIELIVVAIAFSSISATGMRMWDDQHTKPVIVEKVITQNVTQYVDRVEYRDRYGEVDLTFLNESRMSVYEAIIFTEGNIASHQYYLDHPELQNKGTGDTVFQEQVISQYNRLKALLTRLNSEVNKLGEK